MLDDRTPHVAVPVQAVCEGEVIATTLSDDSGRYQLVVLRQEFLQKQVESYQDGYVEYDVEEKRYSHKMAGISDHLHLYNPVAIYRYEYDGDYQRAEGDTLMTFSSFSHLKR